MLGNKHYSVINGRRVRGRDPPWVAPESEMGDHRLAMAGEPDSVADPGDVLREIARRRATEAREAQDHAYRRARHHERLHYLVGAPGAIATPLGAAGFLTDAVPHWASLVAVVGGVLAALSGFLGERSLMNLHWRRRSLLSAVIQKLELAAEGPEPPTPDHLDSLSDAWAAALIAGGFDASK
jgi:hypothetical protein